MLLKIIAITLSVLSLAASDLHECTAYDGTALRVYGASPPVNYLLYALDPDVMVGLNFPLRQRERPYLPKAANLPVIGGWYGQGRTPNLEVLASIRPELTIAWNYRGSFGRIAKTLDTLSLPSCSMVLDRLEDYPAALRTLGRITSREARGERLAKDFERRLADAQERLEAHRSAPPPRVYYAEGVGGLQTECGGSVHAELIERAGGVNVHACTPASGYGMEQIALEQLLLYDPDVIVAFEREFYKSVFGDPRFAGIKAVREGRVYLIPDAPVNWFDRPPSFMRIAGLEWMQWVLHDGRDERALRASLQEFFALWFGDAMSDEAVAMLLHPLGEAEK